MASPPTVFIVDDDPSMLKTLARTVATAGWNTQTYESGEAFLDAFDPTRPGCVILDIRMPYMGGLTVQDRLTTYDPGISIIFISGHGNVPTVVQAMKSGAMDFLEKPFGEQALLTCIERAIACDARRRNEQTQRSTIAERLARLTARERQVLDLVVAGQLNKEIAMQLDISQRTVEIHRHKVMQKMNTDSIVDLARMLFTLQV